MMKHIQSSLIVLVIAYVLVIIAQIWFSLFPDEIFFKVTLTFAILFVCLIAVLLIKRHLLEEDDLKKDKFIK